MDKARAENSCSVLGWPWNPSQLTDAIVLPKIVEEEIVRWVSDLRRHGAPVSWTMLRMQSKEFVIEKGINSTKFNASDTWIKLFLQRHKFALRCRTRQGQTTHADAKEAASNFRKEVLRTMVEKNCGKLYNADQTAIFLNTFPDRQLLIVAAKLFIVFKSNPAKSIETQAINNSIRNGFGVTVGKEGQVFIAIYGNHPARWNANLSIRFLRYHFANRENLDENVLLLWDDLSDHWTKQVVAYADDYNYAVHIKFHCVVGKR
ncbi:LOW QUALITY PROTEIN: hypothetical protein PHMEG_00020323 [Phytophthora megakarya]|uniref:HTH CENPB-type domain-containing protein n=1 Tax=Phytophthora megakarya TaxID=4795 RepID=A0A225VPM4_9STRA|nr:LOW QUALITY PROTEIN: hypothetical protein PHMEG_00020323 [Phytophthora megakarya]